VTAVAAAGSASAAIGTMNASAAATDAPLSFQLFNRRSPEFALDR
jgi:hypothetical protein